MILGPIQVKSWFSNYYIVYFFIQVASIHCIQCIGICQREKEREGGLGIFGFYDITILMQFALWRSSQHCPNEIEHCCPSAFYYVVFWNIFVVAFFFGPENSIYLKKRRKPAWLFCCVFFLPPGNNEQHFDGKVCSIY